MDANKAIKQNKAQSNDECQTVVIENRYSLDVPTFLSPTRKLSADATLQYFNKALDIALQVIDEPKTEFQKAVEELQQTIPELDLKDSLLENMVKISLANSYDLDKAQMSDYTKTKIGRLQAITLAMFQPRTFLNDAVYGIHAFIEGKDTLYHIQIAVGGTSINKLREQMQKVCYSFKEL